MTQVVAPLPVDGVADALRLFGESRMLPSDAYTSAEVFGWEQRFLFAATWMCVGRVDSLFSGTTSQRGLVVGTVPVLLTRDDAGELRAFADTCRHRGHELLGAAGGSDKRSVVCPYHGWSYRLDGSLLAAPRCEGLPGFDASAQGLVALPIEVWHGWVFVNASGDGLDWSAHRGDIDALVAPYQPSSLMSAAQQSYDVAANWKVVTENYHECYHCPLIHPELCRVSPPTSGDNYEPVGAWIGGAMALRDAATTMSLNGASDGVPIEGAPAREVRYLGLLPNLLISLHPDYVLTHRLTPMSASSTRIECEWLFPSAAVDRPGFDPSYAVEFWDITNQQDWAACESVQRGLSSPHHRPGVLAPHEDAVYQFVRRIAAAYCGASLLG